MVNRPLIKLRQNYWTSLLRPPHYSDHVQIQIHVAVQVTTSTTAFFSMDGTPIVSYLTTVKPVLTATFIEMPPLYKDHAPKIS